MQTLSGPGLYAGRAETLVVPQRVYDKQHEYVSHPALRKAFIGGRGSGKTVAGVAALMEIAQQRKCATTIVEPTYRLIHDSIIPVFERLWWPLYTFRKSDMEIDLPNGSLIRLRTVDNPDRLRGPDNAGVLMDEAALMTRYVYRILVATLREGGRSGPIYLTTTPRGRSNWVHDVFGNGREGHFATHASMWDNPFTSMEWKAAMAEEYGVSWFADQELEGRFVDPAGALFQRSWLQVTDIAPWEFEQTVRAWDLAASSKTTADYYAGVKMGITAEQDVYILDVARGQWDWPQGRETIIQCAIADGTDCHVFLEQAGQQRIAYDNLLEDDRLMEHCVDEHRPERDKLTRALPLASRAKAGKVYLMRGAWNESFLDELCSFDGSGKGNDDQVDGASMAYSEVSAPVPSAMRG